MKRKPGRPKAENPLPPPRAVKVTQEQYYHALAVGEGNFSRGVRRLIEVDLAREWIK